MEKRNVRLFQRITSPLWKWGTMVLAVIFIVCNILLLTSVGIEQREVRENVTMIDHLNKLRKSVRSLSRTIVHYTSITDDPWVDLFRDYEINYSRVDLGKAEAAGFLHHVTRADSLVGAMVLVHDMLESIGEESAERAKLEDDFIVYMNLALDELEIAVQKIRIQQAASSSSLSSKLSLLGWLVVFSCLLAICINILFWKYQHDMAGKKKAEEALEKASARVFDLYNNAPCGYHSLDKNGMFVDINTTELKWLGYTRDEVVGRKKFTDVITHDSALLFHTKYPEFRKTGVLNNIEFTMVRKNGTAFPVRVSATAVRDANGDYVKSRSIVIDITGPKMVEEENTNKSIAVINAYKKLEAAARELETVNKELESFSYSVSHDLRAPLRAINGYAKILEEEYGSKLDTEGMRLLGIVMSSAVRMGRLIDDLLSLSKLGRKDVKKMALDMNELTDSTLRELERNQGRPRAMIVVNDLPPAWGDYGLITQVMYNLISNAVKYSSKVEDPVIEISAQALPEEHIYSVKDNGAGFDMEYAHKLFGVFQRLHYDHEFEGTGVGLAIVQRIVSRHGGRVWAEGKVGQGACFYFSLPVK